MLGFVQGIGEVIAALLLAWGAQILWERRSARPKRIARGTVEEEKETNHELGNVWKRSTKSKRRLIGGNDE